MYTFQFINDLIQLGVHTRTLIIYLDGNEVWRNDCDFPSVSSDDDMNNYALNVIATLQQNQGGN